MQIEQNKNFTDYKRGIESAIFLTTKLLTHKDFIKSLTSGLGRQAELTQTDWLLTIRVTHNPTQYPWVTCKNIYIEADTGLL